MLITTLDSYIGSTRNNFYLISKPTKFNFKKFTMKKIFLKSISIVFLTLLFSDLCAQNEDYYAIKLKNGHYKYGVKDSIGKKLTPAIYDESITFKDGIAQVTLNNKWGIINKNGKILIPIKYAYINDHFAYGLFPATTSTNDKIPSHGVSDSLDRIVVPFKYDHCEILAKNIIKVELKGKYGVYNSGPAFHGYNIQTKTSELSGLIIPIIYKDISMATEDLIKVELEDKTQKEVIDKKNIFKTVMGLFDLDGFKILPCDKQYIFEFENGKAKVNEKDGTSYFIDTKGKKLK